MVTYEFNDSVDIYGKQHQPYIYMIRLFQYSFISKSAINITDDMSVHIYDLVVNDMDQLKGILSKHSLVNWFI